LRLINIQIIFVISMENYFINSGIISIVFVLLKFAEMKIILKEDKPLKVILRDGIYVYFSSILGMFLIDQLDYTSSSLSSTKPTNAFIGNPEF
jgi:hypothetical protein